VRVVTTRTLSLTLAIVPRTGEMSVGGVEVEADVEVAAVVLLSFVDASCFAHPAARATAIRYVAALRRKFMLCIGLLSTGYSRKLSRCIGR
jgi:hypothetical protein